MTNEDILIIKELIKESVRSVIKEELANHNKKDLKEVKLLLAKIIKEGMSFGGGQKPIREVSTGNGLSADMKRKLREAVGGEFERSISMDTRNVSPVVPAISAEQAANISVNGTLPDFDAPIPNIDYKSATWRSLKDKLG